MGEKEIIKFLQQKHEENNNSFFSASAIRKATKGGNNICKQAQRMARMAILEQRIEWKPHYTFRIAKPFLAKIKSFKL